MITELQARHMSKQDIIDVLRKSCAKHNVTLVHANYIADDMNLLLLVENRKFVSSVVMEMAGVLIGVFDTNLNQVEDSIALNDTDSECCPVVTAVDSIDDYLQECDLRDGEEIL